MSYFFKKKDRTIQMYAEYTQLNKMAVKNRYPHFVLATYLISSKIL